jgi:hypothetical protein
MYQNYANNLMLNELLRNCKSDEERKKIKSYQGPSLSSVAIAFVLALAFCGIISLLT